jgi:hypothetical protein
MRRAGVKSLIILILGALCVYGCGGGSDGPLDEMGQRYVPFLEVVDNEEETIQVDTVQDACSATEWEDYSDTLANVVITVAKDAPGITLERYTIEYIPLGSPDSSGAVVLPPILSYPATGYSTFSIPSGGSGILPITLVSVDTKDEFNIDMGWLYYDATFVDPVTGEVGAWLYNVPEPNELQIARYTFRITLYFKDTYSGDRNIKIDRTIYLSNYSHC